MASPNSSLNPFLDLTNNNAIVTSCILVGTLEFLVCLPTIPLTIFASVLVHNTSILHQNLKILLISQFVCVFVYIWPRFYPLVMQIFVYRNPFWWVIGYRILYKIQRVVCQKIDLKLFVTQIVPYASLECFFMIPLLNIRKI